MMKIFKYSFAIFAVSFLILPVLALAACEELKGFAEYEDCIQAEKSQAQSDSAVDTQSTINHEIQSARTQSAQADISCKYGYPWCGGEKTDIAGLVKNFYNYALAAVGVAALGAIIFGGVKYTVSAGNPSGQADAISWITGAVWGLVLLLGANLLLRTINPKLVNLEMIKLAPVEVKKIDTAGFRTGDLILPDGNLTRSQLQDASRGGITFNKNECAQNCTANCNCTSTKDMPKRSSDGLLETQKLFGPIKVTGGTEDYINLETGSTIHQTHGPGKTPVDISFDNQTLNGALAKLTPVRITSKGEPVYDIILGNGQKATFVKESNHWHVIY